MHHNVCNQTAVINNKQSDCCNVKYTERRTKNQIANSCSGNTNIIERSKNVDFAETNTDLVHF